MNKSQRVVIIIVHFEVSDIKCNEMTGRLLLVGSIRWWRSSDGSTFDWLRSSDERASNGWGRRRNVINSVRIWIKFVFL